ncbi:hypothetical protein [Halomarina oriensis]|uniref:Uncharacterized protein n=1 Tax=Halomarina oriensis TaxID=671145 RepID=A0A6B0GIZ0_9EURY|nr:hypothetical protein [Halomarina oriensis]MWG33771.1 hypothetical protein [Halomarina oriensis]
MGWVVHESPTHLCLEIEDFNESRLYEYLIENVTMFQRIFGEDERSDYVPVIERCV